ncbi:MAG: DNA-3-methyladenine glycosylase family protein [Candidatus Limnocylindrales bacterium]
MSGERPDPSTDYELAVRPPYRLDLTVTVLRRLPTNPVDLLTADGHYLRALEGRHGLSVVRVRQAAPDLLMVTIDGPPGDHAAILERVRRMLGVDQDLDQFERAAAGLDWLGPVVARMRGVKPPRYPSLWEAFINVIAFQQLSLQSASAIVGRLVRASSAALDIDGLHLHPFPSPDWFLASDDGLLRATGLSGGKIATLRRAATALAGGSLEPSELERLPSPAAAARLQEIKGIGPWTATVILLRGLGRLDVFPMADSSVALNLANVGGPGPIDLERALDTLRPQQGMLYYHLLLTRLEARGALGRASLPG